MRTIRRLCRRFLSFILSAAAVMLPHCARFRQHSFQRCSFVPLGLRRHSGHARRRAGQRRGRRQIQPGRTAFPGAVPGYDRAPSGAGNRPGCHAAPPAAIGALPITPAREAFSLFGGFEHSISLSGIDGSQASLDAGITRYEMAVLANNVLANAPGYTYDTSKVDSSVMPDYDTLPAQYKDAVCRMYSLGILTGQNGGYFNGDRTLTRAKSCVVLSRLQRAYNQMSTSTPAAGGTLEVHYIDVGQADAALVHLRRRSHADRRRQRARILT